MASRSVERHQARYLKRYTNTCCLRRRAILRIPCINETEGSCARLRTSYQTRSFANTSTNKASASSTLAPVSSYVNKHTQRHQHVPFDEQLRRAASVLQTQRIPSEREIQEALNICETLAKSVAAPIERSESAAENEKSPTNDLLALDGQTKQKRRLPVKAVGGSSRIIRQILGTSDDIVSAPKNFITLKHLTTYVEIQTLLGSPESLPAVFDLYASKPVPQPGTSPVQFKNSNWKAASTAIPLKIAESALTSAIRKKDLPLCLGIIDTTVCTPAYKRAKFIRRALFPLSALALSPLAAYTLALQAYQIPGIRDPDLIFNMAAVGLVAYIGFTATIGIVAITTANDQMERVTWMLGTPLRERWIREDERAMIDRVAMAWGFKSKARRGEEEGEDWKHLREWILSRGMILDKPELMEGME